ncbi:type 1 glutamine amidotransferase domain-containing protein [Flavobacterium restrictum]|uniref:Type 1 glutamine amidotransferase domain-containing protein n=1 Tax=Flavobacterium restrictum TaxID=2594428 RepID=A0A553EDM3_9FLAO|nr:type 1 glutamine amidotransferase domain-containing protein [Flavobacterium restrictum]TRX43138.1 type 1 glutamine amidotransferase domain-containing protein [Flavobacterium restrictum]
MKILIVLTSHCKLTNTIRKMGFCIEEFATPYYLFKATEAKITLASPKGGQPLVDPRSDTPENQTESTIRYKTDQKLLQLMANTYKLQEVFAKNFDAVFCVGGHGPLWDLTIDKNSIKLIEDFWDAKKPIAAVCYAPSVLLNVKDKNGAFLIKGKKVTGFSNTEEKAAHLDKIVPYSLEDELKNKGGIYSKNDDCKSYVVKDGLLITGQNLASAAAVANELLAVLDSKKEQN